MDKIEYRELIRSIKNKYQQDDYEGVIAAASQIELEKIRENNILEMIAAAYEKTGRYDLARDTLLIAYKKTPTGKRIAFNLAMLCIKLEDLDSAVMFYEDFCKMAPKDNQKLLLKYEIGKAAGIPVKSLIQVLETYNSREMDDKWQYELARLYHEIGDDEKCADACDQIILWYANGEYEKKALELKNMHKALNASQQARYEEIMKDVIAYPFTSSTKDLDSDDITDEQAEGSVYEGPDSDIQAQEERAPEVIEVEAVHVDAINDEPAFDFEDADFSDERTEETIEAPQEMPEGEALDAQLAADIAQTVEAVKAEETQEAAALEAEKEAEEEKEAQPLPEIDYDTQHLNPAEEDEEDNDENIAGQMSLFAMFEAFKNQTIEDREQMNKLGEDRAAQIMAEVNSAHDSSALEQFETEEDDSQPVEEVIEPEVPLLNREDIIEPVDDGGEDIGERAAEFAFEKEDEEQEEEIQHSKEMSVDATQYIPVAQIASQLKEEIAADDKEAIEPSIVGETNVYSEIDPGSARGKIKVGKTAAEEEMIEERELSVDDFEPGRQITEAERAIIANEITKMLNQEEDKQEIDVEELIEDSAKGETTASDTEPEKETVYVDSETEKESKASDKMQEKEIVISETQIKEEATASDLEPEKESIAFDTDSNKDTIISDTIIKEEKIASDSEIKEEIIIEEKSKVESNNVPNSEQEAVARDIYEAAPKVINISKKQRTQTQNTQRTARQAEAVQREVRNERQNGDRAGAEYEIDKNDINIIAGSRTKKSKPEKRRSGGLFGSLRRRMTEQEEHEDYFFESRQMAMEQDDVEEAQSWGSADLELFDESNETKDAETVSEIKEQETAKESAGNEVEISDEIDKAEGYSKQAHSDSVEIKIDSDAVEITAKEDVDQNEQQTTSDISVEEVYEDIHDEQAEADKETNPDLSVEFDIASDDLPDEDLDQWINEPSDKEIVKQEKKRKKHEQRPVIRGNRTPEQKAAKEEAKILKAQAKIEKAREKQLKAQEKQRELKVQEQLQKAQEAKGKNFDDLLSSVINPDAYKEAQNTDINLDALLAGSIKPDVTAGAVNNASVKENTSFESLDDILNASIKADASPAESILRPESLDDILSAAIRPDESPAAKQNDSEELDDLLNATIKPQQNVSKKEEIMSGLDDLMNSINPEKANSNVVLETTKLDNILSTLKPQIRPSALQPEPKQLSFEDLISGGVAKETKEALSSTKKLALTKKYKLSREQRKDLGEFLMIDGMEEEICSTIEKLVLRKKSGDETGGHLIVTGDAKTGKTFLTIEIIKAVNQEIGHGNPRVAKVQAQAINGKDIKKILSKVTDSDLIIENIGKLEDDTVKDLISAVRQSEASTMIILEGNELAAETLLHNFPDIGKIFKTRINIGELTLTQWADVALKYANGQGYSIDGVALLALHARIDEINTPDIRLGYSQVRKVVDDAIAKAEKHASGKLFSAFSRKTDDSELVALTEEDFM